MHYKHQDKLEISFTIPIVCVLLLKYELEPADTEQSDEGRPRWAVPVHCLISVSVIPVYRHVVKEPEDGFSDEQQESSDEDMEWSGNNSLFANLSIPQLDGAADESSGESSHALTYWDGT